MRNFLFSLLILSGLGNAQAQKMRFYDIKEFEEYQQVLVKALQENKMLFLVIYQDGDSFIKMNRDDVFDNDSLETAYQKTIPLAVDVTSEMGSRLVESFGLKATPSFYYLTDHEEVLLVRDGYQTTKDLQQALAEAEKRAGEYDDLKAKYANNQLTTDEWLELLDIYSLNFSFQQTMDKALLFLNTLDNQQLLSKKVFPVLTAYGLDLETKYPALIIKNKSKFPSDSAYKDFYESVYSYNFDRAAANNDTVVLAKILKVLIPAHPDTSATEADLEFETQKVFAAESQNFNVWKRATLQRAKTEKNDSLKAAFIFDEAYAIADGFNDSTAQKVSLELAKKANDLQPQFRYKMLEAYMAYLLKDYDTAEKLVNEASQLTDNANNDHKAKSLLKMIQKEKPKPGE